MGIFILILGPGNQRLTVVNLLTICLTLKPMLFPDHITPITFLIQCKKKKKKAGILTLEINRDTLVSKWPQ